MKLVWTKSNKILSKIIRVITGDDCSHFAIVLFDGRPGEIMFESNLLGTHPAFFKTSMKDHELVHEHKIACTEAEENFLWDMIVDFYDGCDYDFKGALYLGMKKFQHRVFGSEIPQENKWSDSNKYYCDELIEPVKKVLSLPQVPVATGMKTPHDIWEYFK